MLRRSLLLCYAIRAAVLCMVFAAAPWTQAQDAQRTSSLLTTPTLVSSKWLATHLDSPWLRVVDARGALSAYIKGHIPGAVYLHSETLRTSKGGVPGTMLSPERLAQVFGDLGIDKQTNVVVYSSSEDNFSAATYVAMVLEYLGNPHVAVLDGGIEQWKQEQRPLSQEIPSVKEVTFTPTPKEELLVDAQRVQQAARAEKTQLLDARSPEAFLAGHIPGARNVPLKDVLNKEGEVATWRPKEQLKERFAEAGVEEKSRVITYCTTAREASQLYFTLRHVVGMPEVQVYEGSMVDWNARALPKASEATSATLSR